MHVDMEGNWSKYRRIDQSPTALKLGKIGYICERNNLDYLKYRLKSVHGS